jgi:hypothetical protein
MRNQYGGLQYDSWRIYNEEGDTQLYTARDEISTDIVRDTYRVLLMRMVKTATATEKPGKEYPLVWETRLPANPRTIRAQRNSTPISHQRHTKFQ